MCNKHSFVMTKEGKIFNGGGFVESHSVICNMWGLQQDQVNCYEWRPPEPRPSEEWTKGLVKDLLNFEEKGSHVSALERYIEETFPTDEAWKNYRNYDLHEHKFQDCDTTIIIACKKQLEIKQGETCWARGNSQVTARGNSQVTARGNSQVTARENSQVTARGNSQVTAWGNSQVTARENSSIIKPNDYWENNAKVDLADLAVLIDRSTDGKVIVRKAKKL